MIKRLFILLVLIGAIVGIGMLMNNHTMRTAYAASAANGPCPANGDCVVYTPTPPCLVNTPTTAPTTETPVASETPVTPSPSDTPVTPSPSETPVTPTPSDTPVVTETPVSPPVEFFCLNTNVDHGMYINDFDRAEPGSLGWTNYQHEVAPNGFPFLGQYGNDRVTLTVGCLPAHTAVYLSFDLYIIRSWDGNVTRYTRNEPVGPDHWKLSVEGGQTVIDTTFANWPTFPNTVNFTQSFPGTYPNDVYTAQTGSLAQGRLGYKSFGVVQDSDYHISRMIPHVGDGINTGTYITFVFEGSGLQALFDESWGLDNLIVTTDVLYDSISNNSYYLPEVR